MRPTEERFWSRVQKTDGCWLWTGPPVSRMGYGQLNRAGHQRIYAHRYSWELHHGYIPDRMFVLHTCDTPLCVRPDHLFLGTNQDNMSDMVAKGRSPSNKGRLNPAAVLTEGDVQTIRQRLKRGEQGVVLAREYGVTPTTICDIKYQRSWKEVEH